MIELSQVTLCAIALIVIIVPLSGEEVLPKVCPFARGPVCGSDGQLYETVCDVWNAREGNGKLIPESYGKCENKQPMKIMTKNGPTELKKLILGYPRPPGRLKGLKPFRWKPRPRKPLERPMPELPSSSSDNDEYD